MKDHKELKVDFEPTDIDQSKLEIKIFSKQNKFKKKIQKAFEKFKSNKFFHH
jgi:hypothetical protein